MKIVIDIDEKLYAKFNHKKEVIYRQQQIENMLLEIVNAIRNGVILPKGHGRLIDADAFIKAECSRCDGQCGVCDCDFLNCKSEYRCEFIKDVDSEDVIIEADKEGAEE